MKKILGAALIGLGFAPWALCFVFFIYTNPLPLIVILATLVLTYFGASLLDEK